MYTRSMEDVTAGASKRTEAEASARAARRPSGLLTFIVGALSVLLLLNFIAFGHLPLHLGESRVGVYVEGDYARFVARSLILLSAAAMLSYYLHRWSLHGGRLLTKSEEGPTKTETVGPVRAISRYEKCLPRIEYSDGDLKRLVRQLDSAVNHHKIFERVVLEGVNSRHEITVSPTDARGREIPLLVVLAMPKKGHAVREFDAGATAGNLLDFVSAQAVVFRAICSRVEKFLHQPYTSLPLELKSSIAQLLLYGFSEAGEEYVDEALAQIREASGATVRGGVPSSAIEAHFGSLLRVVTYRRPIIAATANGDLTYYYFRPMASIAESAAPIQWWVRTKATIRALRRLPPKTFVIPLDQAHRAHKYRLSLSVPRGFYVQRAELWDAPTEGSVPAGVRSVDRVTDGKPSANKRQRIWKLLSPAGSGGRAIIPLNKDLHYSSFIGLQEMPLSGSLRVATVNFARGGALNPRLLVRMSEVPPGSSGNAAAVASVTCFLIWLTAGSAGVFSGSVDFAALLLAAPAALAAFFLTARNSIGEFGSSAPKTQNLISMLCSLFAVALYLAIQVCAPTSEGVGAWVSQVLNSGPMESCAVIPKVSERWPAQDSVLFMRHPLWIVLFSVSLLNVLWAYGTLSVSRRRYRDRMPYKDESDLSERGGDRERHAAKKRRKAASIVRLARRGDPAGDLAEPDA